MIYFFFGLVALFSYLAVVLIVRPYLKINFYKNQGGFAYFRAGLGHLKEIRKGLREHDDILHWYCDQTKKNQNIRFFTGNILGKVTVYFKDPVLIKEFLLKQVEHYNKADFVVETFGEMLKSGLVFAEGSTWKKHRKLVSQAFHFEFLRDMVPTVFDVATQFLEKLKTGEGDNIDIMQEIQNITGEVVGRIFFGEEFSKITMDGEPLTKALCNIVTRLGNERREILSIIFGPKFMKLGIMKNHRETKRLQSRFQEICKVLIETKKKNPSTDKNLFKILIDYQNSKSDEFLSDQEIIEEYITFFVAGMDTTGHLITMTLFALLKNPEMLQKVKNEIDQLFPDGLSKASYDDFSKLDYLTCVLKESLRIWSPAPIVFFRKAVDDHQIGDIKITKGTSVTAMFQSNNKDPKIFPEPESFRPERWHDKDQEMILKQNTYLYTPFSAGPRNCIGQHLAMLEAKIILIEFIKRFNFELSDKNYKLKMTARLLYEPFNPILLNIKSNNVIQQ